MVLVVVVLEELLIEEVLQVLVEVVDDTVLVELRLVDLLLEDVLLLLIELVDVM